MASKFSVVQQGPPIEVFAVNKAYLDDPAEVKVNLSVGAYRTDEGKPWVLPVVRKTEKELANNETLNHEYLPVLGLETCSSAATRMLLGPDSSALAQGRNKENSEEVYKNHHLLFVNAGFTEPKQYRYWNAEARSLDLEGFLEDLRAAPKNSVIILHACAHNPTGCDPTHEQWEKIADVIEEKQLFPFFDSAYQDERVGNLTVVVKDASVLTAVKSQFTLIVRGMYSNPPNHGGRIVSTVLNDPQLYEEWKGCVRTMANRVLDMRRGLKERLDKLGTPGTWDHIVTQIGMFSYTGLSQRQVEYMVQKHHIYLLKSGRINMCGLTTKNIDYVANAIHDTVVNVPEGK
ncbi:Aspartate aminotransferase [Blattella germanica]|nr:Aspartate aminotransferase [Blattella germanica]